MKALIKYLPVEGKVKEGDIATAPNYAGFLRVGKLDDMPYSEPHRMCVGIESDTSFDVYAVSELLLQKLFAVTQNIKVGDKICVDGDGMAIVESINNNLSYINFKKENKPCNIIFAPKHICYKILGEVSPKAKFAEDGKEYEVKRYTESVEKEIRQCDSDIDWGVNSSNSDAKCHKKNSFYGFEEKRNTKVCNDCPYNDLTMMAEIGEIKYKIKCPCCGTFK